MSTGGTYSEQLPRQSGPAFGHYAPAPTIEQEEPTGPLDRKSEAMLVVMIALPVLAAYASIAYGVLLAVRAIF